MSARAFLDTNILIYSYSVTEPAKQAIAQRLCQTDGMWISTQVLTEFVNVYRRRFHEPWSGIQTAIEDFEQLFSIHANTPATILRAIGVARRYGFSWFDSLIVAAALECGCQTLYSEDLQNGQLLDMTLRVVNPFA